jgi:integrase
LSKAFNLAEEWGLRPENSNPCRRVRRYKENARERFLSTDELSRLGSALEDAETIGLPWRLNDGAKGKHRAAAEKQRAKINPGALATIRLLVFTGARVSEILQLRWADVDLEGGTLALPERKGGPRRRHPVSAAAIEIIQQLPRVEGSPWTLPAPTNSDNHLSIEVVENAWQRLRAHAGLDDVRLHDLRHTVGTIAAQTGVNAFAVRDLLRHSNTAMTNRYVNRDADPIRALSTAVGERIAAALAGKTPASKVDKQKE